MVKIVSWNVASLRTLPPKLVERKYVNCNAEDALQAMFSDFWSADIVCLQETKFAGPHKCTKSTNQLKSYDAFWSFSGSGYAGVVTYAKKGQVKWWTDNPLNVPLGSETNTKIEQHPLTKGRCVLTDHGDFLLLNIYVINGGRGEEWVQNKLELYDLLLKKVLEWQKLQREVIIAGDINTAHKELDIYHPEKFCRGTGFLPIERKWISAYLKITKSVDAFRYFHPDVRKYSFWDQRMQLRKGNHGWRIDAFYVSDKLLPRLLYSEILNDIFGSDHCPITLGLEGTLEGKYSPLPDPKKEKVVKLSEIWKPEKRKQHESDNEEQINPSNSKKSNLNIHS